MRDPVARDAQVAPHQVAQIGTRGYTHDLDGNVTGWTDSKGGQRRNMTWTADDRMASSADNGSTTTETYDEAGRASRSQYFMLAVMVAFTCFGLFLLSQSNA